MAIRSILMVCQGNICRSPMAEGFFSNELKKIHSPISVNSAGLMAVVNYPPEPQAQQVMGTYGIDISGHRARQINNALVSQHDLILVMTLNQKRVLEKNFFASKGKTYLLGEWHGFQIEDPLKQTTAVFEKVLQQINVAWSDWKTRILQCATV